MKAHRESYLCSTIGRKQIVALTGLGLTLFVLLHMLGNCLIFVSPEAYNTYSHKLTSSALIYIAEVGLVVLFFCHLYLAITLTIANRRARPDGYAMGTNGKKGVSFASKTMIYQGSILLVFVILHLITFKYGPHYTVTYDGVEMRDLHRLVLEVFHSPAYVGWYVICLLLLGLHLSHGVSSSVQTLGGNHPHYNKFIKCFGYFYAVVVSLGFISQPLYVFLKG
jgi:succinate dehydrogenase / fumarate reductase cytochrome b subunit